MPPGFLLLLTYTVCLLDRWIFGVLHRDRFDESLAQSLPAVPTHELLGARRCTAAISFTGAGEKRRKTVPMDGRAVDLERWMRIPKGERVQRGWDASYCASAGRC
ncbi:hypothetical protein C8F01DRAFT_1170895 [Mycena amicta]|nr:hypothetical protein C8F01DRAFT_1188218 [Mycena amicta]KAJ7052367.1 hypothetical protein C8F01DRAFT_1170895 [Mycena amicta]